MAPRIEQLVEKYAASPAPVVITGPIGVGKTYLARLIHARSGRPGSFVPVPLTSLQPGFEHVTLAGHDKGAYTGAHQRRGGLLQEAHRGTLFLDEIGDVSVEGQRLLLELLTEQGLRRLGEERRVRYDLRFILATHVDLDQAVLEGKVREDLLSRLGHAWIALSPLRDRSEEVPSLIEHYLRECTLENGRTAPEVDAELMAILTHAPWIYNIRSLVNECQSLATVRADDGILRVGDLSDRFWNEVRRHLGTLPEDGAIAFALRMTGGHRGRAAELLELPQRTFFRRTAGLVSVPSSRGRRKVPREA
ncbi:MAG: sigma 54-interacting transcriptional regulator [Actinomycetota bacterium]|nr:sigma 54-interacting transcriptional regulator [Actinomycetota bacterium]